MAGVPGLPRLNDGGQPRRCRPLPPYPAPLSSPPSAPGLLTCIAQPLLPLYLVDINAHHLSQGRGGSDGRYDFVFDASTFYTADDATPAQLEALAGHGKRPPKKQPAVRSGD